MSIELDLHCLHYPPAERDDWTREFYASMAYQDGRMELSEFGGSDYGPGPSRARALRRAQAPLVGWVDRDDRLAPGACQVVIEYFAAHPDVSAVYSQVDLIAEDDGRQIATIQREPWRPLSQYLHPGGLLHFMVFRRSVLDVPLTCAQSGETRPAADWLPDLPFTDWIVLFGAATALGPVHCIPQPLYQWRRKRVSISGMITTQERERAQGLVVAPVMAAHRAGCRQ